MDLGEDRLVRGGERGLGVDALLKGGEADGEGWYEAVRSMNVSVGLWKRTAQVGRSRTDPDPG